MRYATRPQRLIRRKLQEAPASRWDRRVLKKVAASWRAVATEEGKRIDPARPPRMAALRFMPLIPRSQPIPSSPAP